MAEAKVRIKKAAKKAPTKVAAKKRAPTRKAATKRAPAKAARKAPKKPTKRASVKKPIVEKKVNGRPPHEPTDKLRSSVSLMAAIGIPHDMIALKIGINQDTLRKHYRSELDLGKVEMLTRVGGRAYQRAMGDGPGSAQLIQFILKTQGGWKETDRLELTGADGGAIETKEMTARDRILSKLTSQSEQREEA